MKSELSGKVSLVTGAARGIGKAIADRLTANGSEVYYTDRDADEVRAAAGSSQWLRLDRRPGAPASAMCLRRGQGRSCQSDQIDGPRAWAGRHPGERNRARLDADRRDAQALLRGGRAVPRIGAKNARSRSDRPARRGRRD